MWNVPDYMSRKSKMQHGTFQEKRNGHDILLLRIVLERSKADLEDRWYGHHGQLTNWPIYSTTQMEGDSNGAND